MPSREYNRDQEWLLPPSLEELVPDDSPARFVAAYVDGLSREDWLAMGMATAGEHLGAPSYCCRMLLSVWLLGFMSGVRSVRKLEAACREQLGYLWLSGGQRPDHNTLWRFYQEYRASMRQLFGRTVRTAVGAGLVGLAVQAVDGTKMGANASRWRTYDQKGLEGLLKRTEEAIAEIERSNQGEGAGGEAKLPAELGEKKALRERVKAAMAEVEAEDGPKSINLTDGDARLMKGRQGIVVGYNAQAGAVRLDGGEAGRRGQLLTAMEVSTEPHDQGEMLGMLAKTEEETGERAGITLFDGGYHSGGNLAAAGAAGYEVLLKESTDKQLDGGYHKDRFVYEAETDTYRCPRGEVLAYAGEKDRGVRGRVRCYKGSVEACGGCPDRAECNRSREKGRTIEISPYEEWLRRNREALATAEGKATYKLRQGLIESCFGILKETLGARRFHLRGLEKVAAEWSLLGTAFNLRVLWRVWRGRLSSGGCTAVLLKPVMG
jgi:transposase